jgi:hypothetical protein
MINLCHASSELSGGGADWLRITKNAEETKEPPVKFWTDTSISMFFLNVSLQFGMEERMPRTTCKLSQSAPAEKHSTDTLSLLL